jgi:hypothetical protein
MRCPSLNELPAPQPGRTGWPWTQESARLPESSSRSGYGSRITVVTPSFNQGRFLEETIRSVLLQGYPDLEYFVLDGGSTDDSVGIIRKYSRWISFWSSERDGGQSAAINCGLRMGSGALATWINSDDMLCKDALTNHFSNVRPAANTVYIGDCVNIDSAGNVLSTHRGRVNSFEELVRVPTVWRTGGSIDQPAVLFPLDLALHVGGLNEANHHTMDYELWGKFFQAGGKVQYTKIPFGVFRCHDDQKTQDGLKQTQSLMETARALIAASTTLSAQTKHEIQAELDAYWMEYPATLWRQSGRLARLGLPRPIVTAIRRSKTRAENLFKRAR